MKRVIAQGGPAVVLYHVIHYALMLALMVLFYLWPVDIEPLADAAAEYLGVELGSRETRLAIAWACAAIANKVLIPVKVWATLRGLPSVTARWNRWRGLSP